MHYTEIGEARSLDVLTGDHVSAHYVVPDAPRIEHGEPVVYQLVPEDKRAWHAGVSEWQGTTELNAASIGIENVNLGPVDTPQGRTGSRIRPRKSMRSSGSRKTSSTRYGIPPTRVVGHSDIAPQRKIDPGPLFHGARCTTRASAHGRTTPTVAAHLAGRDPKSPADVKALQEKLQRYGYDSRHRRRARRQDAPRLQRFQMHFRPADYAGNADAESDAIAAALLDKYFP